MLTYIHCIAHIRHRSLALILDVDDTCKDVQDRNGNTPGHLAAMCHHRYSLQVLQVSCDLGLACTTQPVANW